MKREFPSAVSYNRFVELGKRVFFKLVFFLKLYAFGRCTGISFVDSTMIPVCHNLRRYANKLFADRGYIPPKLFESLFDDGIHLVHGIRTGMKNRLMSFYDRMMLGKRFIIETINDLLKNKAQLVDSGHRSIANFLVNPVAVLGAYCFFENKPEALWGYYVEESKQLTFC